MSTFNDILVQVAAGVTALNLSLNGGTLPVVTRKLAKKEETVDPANQLTVSAAEKQPPVTPWAYGGKFAHEYVIEVTLIAPNNGDQATNIDALAQIKQAITNKFLLPSSVNVTGVWNVRVEDNSFFTRKAIGEGYDHLELIVRVFTVEGTT